MDHPGRKKMLTKNSALAKMETAQMPRTKGLKHMTNEHEMDFENANWLPLEKHLVEEECGDWMWMYRQHGLEHYKHIETRRYLRLDQNGVCYAVKAGGLVPVPFQMEYQEVTK